MRDDEADVTSLGGGAKGFVGKKRSRIARCMIRCRAFGAEEAVGGVDGVSITNACAEVSTTKSAPETSHPYFFED